MLTSSAAERNVGGMDERHAAVVRHFRWQVERTSCPITRAVLATVTVDLERHGPAWTTLRPHAHLPGTAALSLRLAGACHRLALRGDAPDYARHLPTCGGDGDAELAAKAALQLVAGNAVADELRPVQTNEPGRLAAIHPALALIHRRTGHPLRLLEIGASAGLLLVPPADVPITGRRGCDPNPLHPADPEHRLLLLSFVWAGQVERFRNLERALDVAATDPAPVDVADAGDWLAAQLTGRRAGRTTVVLHSVVWQYLPASTKQAVDLALAGAARRATTDAPLAYLRFEPVDDHAETRVTHWPGGDEHLLASSGYHGSPLEWRGDAA